MIPKRSIIPIFVPHLGCPNFCVFCDQRSITGSVSAPDENSVRETITAALGNAAQDIETQVAFYGGSFTAIPVGEQERLLDAAVPFLHSGKVSSLRVSTRPDAIDEERLSLLKTHGVKTIELGTQSMCDEVLSASRRGHTALQTEKAVELIRKYDFELILQMMTGLPGDTKQRSIETAAKIIALKPDGVRIYPSVILENTPMEDMWRAGEYPEHTVEEAVDWCAEIVPMFEEADIPIIRLGLNPTQELSGGAAVAGAYHPALGELVRSRIMLRKAQKLLDESSAQSVIIGVNTSDISTMTGQHRCNIEALEKQYLDKAICIRPAPVSRGDVVLIQEN